MPGWSSARRVDARVSATSSPARRSAASSSGRESGLRPGRRVPAHLVDQGLEQLRPGAARRPGPEQVGEQPLVHVDAPRHPGVRHLGRHERARRLGREQQPEPGRLGRRRDRGQLSGVLEVGAQVLGGVVDGEQRRVRRRARPEPVPVLRLLPVSSRRSTAGARRSRWWPSRRSWQRATRTPAASSGGYQRAVSSQTHRGRVGLALRDVRRQLAQRHLGAHRRRPPAPAHRAGGRARSGSWGQPDTPGSAALRYRADRRQRRPFRPAATRRTRRGSCRFRPNAPTAAPARLPGRDERGTGAHRHGSEPRVRMRLQVQPPGRLGRTPTVHGHRDEPVAVLDVAQDDPSRPSAASPGGGEPECAPLPGFGRHNPSRPRVARNSARCACQNPTMNQRGCRLACPS